MAVPGQIRGGFAGTGAGIQIGRYALPRLRRAQVAPVFGLADGDVAGRKIDQHGGTDDSLLFAVVQTSGAPVSRLPAAQCRDAG